MRLRVFVIQILLVPASCVFGSGLDANVESDSLRVPAIYAPRPEYPIEARRQHLTGSGVLLLHINRKTGTVTSIDIEKSIGYKILDDAAVGAFLRWRFKPGRYTKVRVPIRYTMDQSQIPKAARQH